MKIKVATKRETPTVFQPVGRWTLMHGLTQPTSAKTAGWTPVELANWIWQFETIHLIIRLKQLIPSDMPGTLGLLCHCASKFDLHLCSHHAESAEIRGITIPMNNLEADLLRGLREAEVFAEIRARQLRPTPTLSWLTKLSFDFKPLVPQSMSLYEPTSWAAYSPSPWCCSAFKHLATIWHLRRATGIQGMQGHAMLGRHHDHHGTLWPCSKSFSSRDGGLAWMEDVQCSTFKSVTHLLELTWDCDTIWDCKAGLILPLTYF